jgi:HK97 family phage portal protein
VGLVRQLVERRAHPTGSPANPPGWLMNFFGGGQSASGQWVTTDSAMTVSAVFAAVKLIADSVSTLPLNVYERRTDRGKDLLPTHPVARLLDDQPNAWQTAVDFRATMQAFVELRGNAYAKKLIDGRGVVTALLPLHPDRVRVLLAPDGTLWYHWTPLYPGGITGEPETLHQDEVLHRRGLSLDGYLGMSTIAYAREAIGASRAAEEYGARFFANSAQPSGALTFPKKLSKEGYERVRDAWAAKHGGSGNAHRPAILEDGMQWQQMQLTNADSQFLESRKFSVTDIARWFGVPPHMIADLDRSTNNNIEQQSLELVIYSLRPRLVRAEAEYRRDLLLDRERGTLTIKHLVDGLLRGDFQTRMAGYAQGRQWGWYSVNDINELEDRNPVANGDVYLQPLNMVPAGSDPMADAVARKGTTADPNAVADGSADPAAAARNMELALAQAISRRDSPTRRAIDGALSGRPLDAVLSGRPLDGRRVHERSLVVRMRVTRAARAVFEDGAARSVRREVEAARRMLRRAADMPDVLGVASCVASWQAEWLGEHRVFMERALVPAVRMLAESVAGEAAWEVQSEASLELDAFAMDFVAGVARREAVTSRTLADAIGSASSITDAIAALEARLLLWESARAEALADRETVQCGASAARAVWRAAGIPYVRLVADGNCAVGRALDGRVRSIDEPLLAAGEAIVLADGSTWTASMARAHPPFSDGCRCGLAPALSLPGA